MIHNLDFTEREKDLIIDGISELINKVSSRKPMFLNKVNKKDTTDTIAELIQLKNKVATYYIVSKSLNSRAA